MILAVPLMADSTQEVKTVPLDPIIDFQNAFKDLESAWAQGDIHRISRYIDPNTRIVFATMPAGPKMYSPTHLKALLKTKFSQCHNRMFRFVKFRNIEVPNSAPYGVARCKCLDNNSPAAQEEIIYVSLRVNGRHPVIESIKTQTLSATQPPALLPHN